MSFVKTVESESFEREVLDAAVPVVVDFYAPWCGPCQSLAPTLEAAAAEYAGRVKLLKINVDDAINLSHALGVVAVPTLLFFTGSRLVDRASGALSAAALRQRLDALERRSLSPTY